MNIVKPHDCMYSGAYWSVQEVLDFALGTEEKDGAGAGLVEDVCLVVKQRDAAVARAEEAEAEVARLRAWLTSDEAIRIIYNHAQWDDVYDGAVKGLTALAAALEATDAP